MRSQSEPRRWGQCSATTRPPTSSSACWRCCTTRHGRGAELVVYPELALTTFFPRWFFEDEAEIDSWFETEMPSVDTKPLFDEAARLGVGFCLGFAEKTPEGHRYNTQVLVGRDGREVGRYRKVHLPGHDQHEPWREFQHLEKRYFEVGPDGFQVWRASAASWEWRSATTVVGPRPTGCSGCRAPSSC